MRATRSGAQDGGDAGGERGLAGRGIADDAQDDGVVDDAVRIGMGSGLRARRHGIGSQLVSSWRSPVTPEIISVWVR